MQESENMLLEFIYGLSVFGLLLLLAYSLLRLLSGQKIEIGRAGSPRLGAGKPSAASKRIYSAYPTMEMPAVFASSIILSLFRTMHLFASTARTRARTVFIAFNVSKPITGTSNLIS